VRRESVARRVSECEALNRLGGTILAMNDLDHAEQTFRQAREVAEKSGSGL
jgi:hypothetical protein